MSEVHIGTIPPGLLYRHENARPTAAEYDEAIAELECARSQLAPDGHNCAVCGDSGHQAFECHHNPLVVARRWTAATSVWRCYHCDFTARNEDQAKAHFGATNTGDPTSCLLARLEAKDGVIRELAEKLKAATLDVAPEGWERRQGMRAAGGWHWSTWQPCTAAEAQRVTGLRSWEVRSTGQCPACDGIGAGMARLRKPAHGGYPEVARG